MHRLISALLLCCIVIVPRQSPVAQEQAQRQSEAKTPYLCTQIGPNDLGIHVDCPKIYDNSALELMLAAAQQDLARLKFLDQAGVAKQVGAIQGGTATESNFGAQVTGTPTPQISSTTGGTTGQTQGTSSTVAPSGTTTGATSSATSGTSTSETVTRTAVSPTVPTLGALSGASSLPSTFSNSALDTLNEQMQLTYEIANLRLLLEGSLSDHFQRTSSTAKRRATIGFPISIEPPATVAGHCAVAEVVVTVTTSDTGFPPAKKKLEELSGKLKSEGIELDVTELTKEQIDQYYKDEENRLKALRDQYTVFRGYEVTGRKPEEVPEPPGLVAILPRERTYNTALITDNAKSFAGAAVVSVVNLGISWTRRTKTFYLLQDLDTVALERVADSEKPAQSTTFAWQFRPVLNQPSVHTGLRQTFVQLAFPVFRGAWYYGSATVKVRWRKYDPKTRAVGDTIKWKNPKTRMKEFMQATVYENAPITNFDLTPAPQLTTVQDLGQGRVALQVDGDFLPDTYVRLGDAILDEPSKTLFRDTSGLRFFAPAASLLGFGATVVARDGSYTPLRAVSPGCGLDGPSNVVTIVGQSVTAKPFSNTESMVTIPLDKAKSKFFPNDPFVVLVGGIVYGLRDTPLRSTATAAHPDITFVAPTAILRAAGSLKVGRLLCGNLARADINIVGDFTAAKALTIAKSEGETKFAIMGSGFMQCDPAQPQLPCVKLKTSSKVDIEPQVLSETVLLFSLKGDDARQSKQVVISQDDAQPLILQLPTPDDKRPAPKLGPITKQSSGRFNFQGDNIDQVKAVFSDSARDLNFKLTPDKKAFTLDLPSDITDHIGTHKLTFVLKDDTQLPFLITVRETAATNKSK